MDYVGALVANRRGLRSIEKWKEERLQFLQRFYSLKPISKEEVFFLILRSWAGFLVVNPEYKADLLITYLFKKQAEGLKAIPEYYRQSEDTDNVYKVWEQAFE